MAPIAGVEFVHLDFLDARAPDAIKSLLAGPVDVVAFPTWRRTPPGIARPIISSIMALAEAASDFAREVLAPGAPFSARCCRAAPRARCCRLRRDFAAVKHVKPAASRGDSAEFYLLAMGFSRPNNFGAARNRMT